MTGGDRLLMGISNNRQQASLAPILQRSWYLLILLRASGGTWLTGALRTIAWSLPL